MAAQTIRRIVFPAPERALDIIGAWLIGGAVMSALSTAIGRQVPLIFVPYVWDPLESTCRHASLSIL